MAGYPSRQEFFAWGLPAKAFSRQPMAVAAADPAADVFTVRSHGLSTGDRARFEVNAGGAGAAPGVLPAGLSASVLYFVIGVEALGTDMFQVSLTDGGGALDITDTGSPVFGVCADLGAKIDLQLDSVSRHADQHLTGNATPLATAPSHLKQYICEIAAWKLATTAGLVDPQYAADPSLKARAEEAQRQLDKLQRNGEELVGGTVDATPNIVDNGAIGFGDPPRCWSPGGIL